MRKGYRMPWTPQARKQVSRKYPAGFKKEGQVSGGIAHVVEWIIVEILSLSASIAQLALLVARRWMYIDLFAAHTNFWKHPIPQLVPPIGPSNETPTRFLHTEDKKESYFVYRGSLGHPLPASQVEANTLSITIR